MALFSRITARAGRTLALIKLSDAHVFYNTKVSYLKHALKANEDVLATLRLLPAYVDVRDRIADFGLSVEGLSLQAEGLESYILAYQRYVDALEVSQSEIHLAELEGAKHTLLHLLLVLTEMQRQELAVS